MKFFFHKILVSIFQICFEITYNARSAINKLKLFARNFQNGLFLRSKFFSLPKFEKNSSYAVDDMNL